MSFVRHVEATFFEPHPEAFQRPTERDSAFRITLATAPAGRTGMHSVEIARNVMPTIGLHAIGVEDATLRLSPTGRSWPSWLVLPCLSELPDRGTDAIPPVLGTRQSGECKCSKAGIWPTNFLLIWALSLDVSYAGRSVW